MACLGAAHALVAPCVCRAAKWSLQRADSVVLAPPEGVTVAEMSGVSYVGPAASGGHRFVAAQDTTGELVFFDVDVNAAGEFLSVGEFSVLSVSPVLDYEGVAFGGVGRESVFLAEENNPGVHKHALSDGSRIRSAAIPPVFSSRVDNRGFESLGVSADGATLWTANEEALGVDGATATADAGTTVRLLQIARGESELTAGAQFAYEVDAIHAAGVPQLDRSGLADLAVLPDGTLLTLERSFAVLASPKYRSQVYEVDYSAATDVSTAEFEEGLAGRPFDPVSKQLLWQGAVDDRLGQNLEGLALGPRLPGGDWLMIGVVDDSGGGDPFSANTLVSFILSALPSADFNQSGQVDGRDLVAWQRGFGIDVGAAHDQGDGDRDGDVDASDLRLWESEFPARASLGGAAPEPRSDALLVLSSLLLAALARLLQSGGRRWVGGRADAAALGDQHFSA